MEPEAEEARRRRVPTGLLVAASVVVLLVAVSRDVTAWLLSHDALPSSFGWLWWPGSPAKSVVLAATVVALVLLTWLAFRMGRRWWLLCLAVIAAAALIGTPLVPAPGARNLFNLMRPQLDEIASLRVVTNGPAVYSVDLPPRLADVAANGTVTPDGAGGVFVPLWTGTPDDAGGFWFTPGTSPAGRDMRGMICDGPVRLDGDWWACGVDSDRSAQP